MSSIVVDASVILNYLLPDEKLSGATGVLLDDPQVVKRAPKLIDFEVMNTLVVAIRRGRLVRQQATSIYDAFDKMNLKYDSPDGGAIIERATEWGLSGYDATYLQLAVEKEAKLLSGDNSLIRVAKKVGVKIAASTT